MKFYLAINLSRNTMKKLIIIFILLISFQLSFAMESKYSRAKIWFDGKSELTLGRLGIDLTEGDYRNGVWFISDFSEQEISRVVAAGFRVEILITDLKTFYRDRNNNSNRKINQTSSCGLPPSPLYNVPVHFYLGEMGGFFKYTQLQNILDSMTILYPNLVTIKQPIDTTLTIEGRPIYFLKLYDNPGMD